MTELLERYPGAETFKFGDGPDLSARLIGLVRAGRKTATCGALRDFEEEGEALPVVGRRDVALDWDGMPALVVETVSVEFCAFEDVSAEFALAEGENESREGWARDHRAFFERNGGYAPDMMLVCERFVVVEDLGDVEVTDHVGDEVAP